jgi:TonB family protein
MPKTNSSRRVGRSRSLSNLLSYALLGSLSVVTVLNTHELHAQSVQTEKQVEKNQRKTVYRVEPEYPEDLKRIGVGGYVRVDATISPSGTVEDATIAGGNPILAEAALKAVKKWKYVAQDSQTKARLIFHFSP